MARILTEEKHDSLLEAAIELFREKEYGDVTVREIVAQAGSSPATFYRYFETKEKVHEEILNIFLARYLEVWVSIYSLFADGIEDMESALKATEIALEKIFEFYRDNRDLAGAIFRWGATVDERFAKQGQQVTDMTLVQMEQVLKTWRSEGLVRDLEPKVWAVAAFGAIFSVAVECIVRDRRDDIKNLVRQGMRIIRHGLASAE
jgi:TetR/AcrR family transcriptional regulator